MADTLTVRGVREAKAVFKMLEPRTKRLLNKHATKPTAEAVLAAAVQRVPVQHGVLKAHLGFSMGGGRARVGVRRGSVTVGGRLHAPGRTAHLVEFGTADARPQPFMIPAAEGQVGPYLARVRAAVKLIERATAPVVK